MQVVRVSGTIRKAEEEAVRRARLSIIRASKATRNAPVAVGVSGNSVDDADAGFLNMMDGIEDRDEPGDVDEDEDG